MKRRTFSKISAAAMPALMIDPTNHSINLKAEPIRIGVIGLDTSHSLAFTKIINQKNDDGLSATGFEVTHAFPHGSRDIESSVSRIPGYTKDIMELGVQVVDSLGELLDQCEAVLLETNDGRLHLEQAIQVFEKGLITFIDKPIAASLADTLKIFASAKEHQLPMFSASSLRFGPIIQEIASGDKIGRIIGADTFSPAKIEKTHPDLFWYGIHGVESLYTLMGRGCQSVTRVHNPDVDIVTGLWNDDRVGTFRGLRAGKTGYGGQAFGTEGIAEAGMYEGYEPLVVEILKFFKSGISPIEPEETIEIFAFMTAAEESKRRGGSKVTLTEVIDEAK